MRRRAAPRLAAVVVLREVTVVDFLRVLRQAEIPLRRHRGRAGKFIFWLVRFIATAFSMRVGVALDPAEERHLQPVRHRQVSLANQVSIETKPSASP
jgi:hypothetical protein